MNIPVNNAMVFAKFFLFVLAVAFFAGCEIQEKSKVGEDTKIFVPKENIKKESNTSGAINTADVALVSSTPLPANMKEVRGDVYTLIDQKKSPEGKKIWKLFSTNDSDCTDKKGLCIFEVWEDEEKIFFVEEGTPGDITELYYSIPQFWLSEDSIGFIQTDEREISQRTLLHSLDIYSGQLTYVWKSVKWKKKAEDTKNTITIVTLKGNAYFLDAVSSSSKISLYKIINPSEEFYVGRNLKNLKFLGSTNVAITEEVLVIPNPNTIEFYIDGKNYVYDRQKGIIEEV